VLKKLLGSHLSTRWRTGVAGSELYIVSISLHQFGLLCIAIVVGHMGIYSVEPD